MDTQNMMTPEGYEKKKIRGYLDSIMCWYFIPYAAGYGKSGVSDIVGCYSGGRFFVIEVKRPGGTPTKLQDLRMQQVREVGGTAFWGDADKVIREFKAWLVQLSSSGMDTSSPKPRDIMNQR